MAISLASISNAKAVRAPRQILLGVEKVGKSTWAAGSDKPIFIPIKGEQGIDDLDVQTFPVANSFADVMQCITSLYSEDHDFKTVVIDSGSTLEPLVWDATCAAHNVSGIEQVLKGYGKGFTEALKWWRELTDGLDALREKKNMGSILIGHVKVKTFNDPLLDPYDTFNFDVNDKAREMLFRWADSIVFANRKTVVNTTEGAFNKTIARGVDMNQVVLYTQKRPAHPGGGRGVYGRLPYEMPLDYAKFREAVEQAYAIKTA